jgi:DNA-binding MarR family transcriptional regulator
LLRDVLACHTDPWHLSVPQFSVLWACRASDAAVSQNDLAADLAVSAAHVSGLVEQLREKNLLESHRAAADRRRQFWRLTPTGAALLNSIVTGLRDWAGSLDARLGPDGPRILAQLLRHLVEALRTEPGRNAETTLRQGAA